MSSHNSEVSAVKEGKEILDDQEHRYKISFGYNIFSFVIRKLFAFVINRLVVLFLIELGEF